MVEACYDEINELSVAMARCLAYDEIDPRDLVHG